MGQSKSKEQQPQLSFNGINCDSNDDYDKIISEMDARHERRTDGICYDCCLNIPFTQIPDKNGIMRVVHIDGAKLVRCRCSYGSYLSDPSLKHYCSESCKHPKTYPI
jgi:hypothetical protein